MKTAIHTINAPAAIGPYSQAIQYGNLVFLSGQIALLPSGELVESEDIMIQTRQVFSNLRAVAMAAGGTLDQIVKLTIYLINFEHFSAVNEVMREFFTEPFPARATVQVVALPKNVPIEVDAILVLD